MDKKELFVAAVKDNQGMLFKIASVYCNNVDDKNDLVQEIVYQLWKSFDSFSQKSSLSTWIYRVALNVAIYHLKVSKKRVSTVPIEEQFLNYPNHDATEIENRWELFRKQVEMLNLMDKAIIMLYLENKSYDDIAEIIGISPTNVGTKLSRIRERLKSQISKQI